MITTEPFERLLADCVQPVLDDNPDRIDALLRTSHTVDVERIQTVADTLACATVTRLALAHREDH